MATTILVVDDELANQELMIELLQPQGYKILTAADGQAALEEFARNQPDLVLLDIMMPRVDGVEVC